MLTKPSLAIRRSIGSNPADNTNEIRDFTVAPEAA